jgi:hypothetical protein
MIETTMPKGNGDVQWPTSGDRMLAQAAPQREGHR